MRSRRAWSLYCNHLKMPPKKVSATTSSKNARKISVKGSSRLDSCKSTEQPLCRSSKGPVKAVTKVPPKKGSATAKGKVTKKTTSEVSSSECDKKPMKKEWTKLDDCASKIQAAFRGYCCRKLLLQLKAKREEYDSLIENLERQAFVEMVKMEREQLEKQHKKEEEQRRIKQEEEKRRKKMLELAFDGLTDEIHEVLDEMDVVLSKTPKVLPPVILDKYRLALIDCCDANGNTPLSEASAGGHPETIMRLFNLGANPNSKGAFGRTPLYRAAFAGHTEAVKALLECGADPRMYADDGATPEQITSKDEVKSVFQSWNVEYTEKLVKLFAEKEDKRILEQKAYYKNEENKISNDLSSSERESSAKQKEMKMAYEQLNARIAEHDKAVAAGFDKPEITLQGIHEAEAYLKECKLRADKAREKVAHIRCLLRETKSEVNHGETVEVDVLGLRVTVKDLDDVLFRDVGNKMLKDGRWPLIIDPSQLCATFLRYRDTNFLNIMKHSDMAPESIRMALLGALRYGKFAVLDLLDMDLWDAAIERFDAVQKGLMDDILSKSILENESYLSLLKSGDGKEYKPEQFLSGKLHKFKFVVLTQVQDPPKELMNAMYVINVVPH